MIVDVLITVGLFCLGLLTLLLDWGMVTSVKKAIPEKAPFPRKIKAALEFAFCLIFLLTATAGSWVTFFARLSALLQC